MVDVLLGVLLDDDVDDVVVMFGSCRRLNGVDEAMSDVQSGQPVIPAGRPRARFYCTRPHVPWSEPAFMVTPHFVEPSGNIVFFREAKCLAVDRGQRRGRERIESACQTIFVVIAFVLGGANSLLTISDIFGTTIVYVSTKCTRFGMWHFQIEEECTCPALTCAQVSTPLHL